MKSTEMKILIILPKITPKIIENIICITTLKSNFTLLLQFRHVLVSQKGEINMNNSHMMNVNYNTRLTTIKIPEIKN